MSADIVVVILTTGTDDRRPYVDRLRLAIPGRVPLRVHVDHGQPPSHRRGYDGAWEAAYRLFRQQSAKVALVLEDDAVPCRAFWPNVQAALVAAQHDRPRAVSFCCRRMAALYHHRSVDGHWWAQADWRNSEAIALPTGWISGYLQTAGSRAPEYGDVTMMEYLRERGESLWFTVPSLVQHGLPSGSLLGNSRANRISPVFVDDATNELTMPTDWRPGLPYYTPEET